MEDDQHSDDVTEQALRQLHQDVDALAEGLAHCLESLAQRIAATDGLGAQPPPGTTSLMGPGPGAGWRRPPQPDAVGSSVPPVVRP